MMSTHLALMESLGNTTLATPAAETEKAQIISDRLLYLINIYLYFLVCGLIALFGMANNIVNMIIFHRLGLNDSMSVGLMSLSLTDFMVSFLGGMRISFFMWDTLVPQSGVKLIAVNQVSIGWLRDAFFLCSAWVTAFLSVERCVCVVYPFRVKEIFTRLRCLIAVAVIYVVNIGLHTPVFVSGKLVWRKVEVETSNGTEVRDHLVAKFADNWPQVQLFTDILTGAILPMPSQAIVLISVIMMIYGLNASSKIRGTKTLSEQETAAKSGKKESNLTSKERRLLKVVILLAIILTICNIPRFIAVYAPQLFPEVNYGNAFWNLYIFLWVIANASSVVNASVNIFVYLFVNSSYRAKFNEIFCRHRVEK